MIEDLGIPVFVDYSSYESHPLGWITRSLSDQAEKAGSIQVAVIQLANTCGAAVGGVALDHLGLLSPLVLSGTLMLITGLLVATKVRV